MIRRIILPIIVGVLLYGFWASSNFEQIAAGVAIFLFGMLFLEEGFRMFTGGLLEKVLEAATDKKWKSVGFGVLTTTLLQSSSLVSVITISFLSAELIGLASGIGIIFGSNIGTTTGAWLIAGLGLKVKLSAYAMPMLVLGVVFVFQNSNGWKGLGYILAGLGFLFLGIHHMKEGFEAFRTTIDLTAFAVPGYAGLFIFAAIGIAATVIMQSSHATLVLIITALAAGQITYENALALAIGANVGTTITAVIGALSANYQGKRLAGAHLIFNMVTGVIAIVLINQFVLAVDNTAEFFGIAADNYTLKLAIFHTIFNVVGVAVMYPLVDRLVAFLEKALPAPQADVDTAIYLNDSVADFPETLLQAVRNETLHLYDNAYEIIANGIDLERPFLESEGDLQKYISEDHRVEPVDIDDVYERKVKVLFGQILDFISRHQSKMPSEFSHELYDLRQTCLQIVKCVKAVKHLRKNLIRHADADNEYLRKEYDVLRLEVANLLRTLSYIQSEAREDRDVLDLDSYKVDIDLESGFVDDTVDSLIRENKITPVMATSLINDYGYTRELVWSLVEIGKTLLGERDDDAKAVESLLSLDDDELETVSN